MDTFEKLLSRLQTEYPSINYKEGESFLWSPRTKTVTYAISSTQPERSTWSLLHEVSHGILMHQHYENDFELVKLETEAWQYARSLGERYNIKIDQEHVQDCLDTYRDWLFHRSTCPSCGSTSTQDNSKSYTCFNCKSSWTVSNSRFCRPYRLKSPKN